MARYYYTDALKAAWMAKNFGVHTEQGSKETGDYIINDPASFFHFLKDELPKTINSREERKYYIHSKDYEMLKPQVGDLIDAYEAGWIGVIDRIGSYYDYAVKRFGSNYNQDYDDTKEKCDARTAQDKLTLTLWSEYEKEPSFYSIIDPNDRGCSILQRNGKAWFTPEIEGD